MKKIIGTLLCMCMIVAVLAGFSVSAADVVAWDGTTATSFAGGDGTKGNPYQIANGAQLALMKSKIDDGSANTACFKLTADIVLNADMATPSNVWTPIKGGDTGFKGTLDGDGHTISGLYVEGAGFFSHIEAATIKNLVITNAKVENTGNTATSVLAAWISGSGSTIDSVYIQATVNAADKNVGGFVGLLGSSSTNTVISNCVFDGSVTSQNYYVGGIVGNGNGGGSQITNCINFGSVTGTGYNSGIIGTNNSNCTVTNCINLNANVKFGIGSSTKASSKLTISNCWYMGEIAGNESSISATDVVKLDNMDALIGNNASICPEGFSKRDGDVIIPTTMLEVAPRYIRKVTVTWKSGDTVIATEEYNIGDTPSYKGETPTKADDDKYIYTFNGWTPIITALTGDAVYEADFFRTRKASETTNNGGENTTSDDFSATETVSDSTEGVDEDKGGCGSVIGGGAIAILAVIGSAVVLGRKKED